MAKDLVCGLQVNEQQYKQQFDRDPQRYDEPQTAQR